MRHGKRMYGCIFNQSDGADGSGNMASAGSGDNPAAAGTTSTNSNVTDGASTIDAKTDGQGAQS